MKRIVILPIIFMGFYPSLYLNAKDLKLPKTNIPNRYPTLNKMGWVAPPDDPISKAYIEFVISNKVNTSLEVGAGYGMVLKEILKKQFSDNKEFLINDLGEKHLLILKESLSKNEKKLVKFLPGNFLKDITVKEKSIDAILASRVLHMLNGKELEHAVMFFNKSLKINGKLFIVVGTPYNKGWKKFLPEYNDRKLKGVKFPGLILDPAKWCKERSQNLPKYIHLLDIDIMSLLLKGAGFKIQKYEYIIREDTNDNFVPGKTESLGIIAIKVKNVYE